MSRWGWVILFIVAGLAGMVEGLADLPTGLVVGFAMLGYGGGLVTGFLTDWNAMEGAAREKAARAHWDVAYAREIADAHGYTWAAKDGVLCEGCGDNVLEYQGRTGA